MAIEIVFETHATTEDNEHGLATGWLPGRLSPAGRAQAVDLGARRRDDPQPRWALDHLLDGKALEDVVDADFAWQEGWEYVKR